MNFFEVILYQPMYNLLVFFYDVLPIQDIGLAIIIVTIIIKGLLFPLTYKTLKSQRDMQKIQPKIKKIREEYKEDKEQMAQELMAVYKENNVNPLASCLPLLIQLPIFIALFRVLQRGLGEVRADLLYSFVPNPGTVDPMFFDLIDLAAVSVPLAVLAAIAQYFQVKYTITRRVQKKLRKKEGAKDEDMMANMNKMMLYFMPVLTLVIGVTSLPGGVMLYWLTTTLLTIVLYAIFLREKKEKNGEEKTE